MKSLFLTRQQALLLSIQLARHAETKDPTDRNMFEAMEVRYGDDISQSASEDACVEIHPIPFVTTVT